MSFKKLTRNLPATLSKFILILNEVPHIISSQIIQNGREVLKEISWYHEAFQGHAFVNLKLQHDLNLPQLTQLTSSRLFPCW